MLKKINKKLHELSFHYPKTVIFYTLLFTTIIFFGIKYLKQDDNIINLLPEDIGSRIIFTEIQDEYGLTEYMYVAVGNKENNIFNQKSLEIIWDLTKEFEKINEVDEIISISNFNQISLDPEDNESFLISDMMKYRTLNENDIYELENYLNNNLTIKKRLVSKQSNYANIIVVPKNSDVYKQITDQIHIITEKYKNENIEFYFGGQTYVTGAVPGMVQNEVKILLLYGLSIMTLILFINLRSIKGVAIILIIIFNSLMSMMGFMGWVYHFLEIDEFYFTMMNTSMPIVLLTIANSDGVHIVSKFFKFLRIEKNKEIAVRKTMESLSFPIFLTSITTSLAFLTLYFSPVRAMVGYGITLAFGIMWAWLISNTLLPSIMILMNWDLKSKAISKPSYIENMMKKFGEIICKKPKTILVLGLSTVSIAAIGIFFITVEVQYTKMFRKGNIIRDSSDFLDQEMVGNVNLILRVTDTTNVENSFKEPKNLIEIERLQNFLDNMENVKSTISINDVIKQLHKTIEKNDQDYYTIPDSRSKVNNLFTLYEWNDDADVSSLINYDKNQTIITALMTTFSTQKVAGYENDINNFINNNIEQDNLKIELTGVMAFLVDFMWLVVKSSILSLAISIIVILCVSSIFLKSLKYGIMGTIPLTAAVTLNFGLMGWFGIELTHLTALLSSIIIGVGVDFSIHYISEFRRFLKTTDKENVSKKCLDNVGYPIILDAWSNMGFGALLLSSIIPLGQVGGLMVFAMLSTSIGALTLLASMLEIFKNKLN